MGLLAEALEIQEAARPVRCNMCRELSRMDERVAGEWREVFANPEVAHVTISRLLERHGIKLSESAIKNHRKRCA